MERLRYMLGAALVLILVAGSAAIVYFDRPVMGLQTAGTTNVAAPPAAELVAGEEGGSEEGEDGEEGTGIQTAPAPAPAQSPASPAGGGAPAPAGYTMNDVRAHATAGSCWSAINGSVYDLTSWISRHPGGMNVIIALCGTDGSAAYNGQHGGRQRPQYYLALLKIGTLR